jgi:hypothetical protein
MAETHMSQPYPWVCNQGKGLWGYGLKRKPKSHISCSRECKRVWGNKPSHSQGDSHCGELESQWTSKFSKSDCRGQDPMDWRVPYTIRKVLELRCWKWVRMTHLDI